MYELVVGVGAGGFRGPGVFLASLPVLASAMAALALGGLAGVGFMAVIAGYSPGPLGALSGLYGVHWLLMIYGFTLALISAEVLTLLSFEWSGRVAPAWLRVLFLAFYWAGVALYASGRVEQGLAASTAAALVAGAFAARSLLGRSRLGLPPTHYNYLLSATLPLFAALTLYALAAPRLGLPGLDLALASLFLPVATIIAVVSRDLPLLLGVPPTRGLVEKMRGLRLRAAVAYAASGAGIVLVAAGLELAGGLLLAAGAVVGAASTGLVEALEAAGRGVPGYVRRHVSWHVAASYAWLAAAGLLAAAWGAGLLEGARAVADAYAHMIALGFMFTIIMGVDAVLLYGHAGVPVEKAPRPQPWTGLLLNASVAVRVAYGLGAAPAAAGPASALMALAAIAGFYARNMSRLAGILLSQARARGG